MEAYQSIKHFSLMSQELGEIYIDNKWSHQSVSILELVAEEEKVAEE